jgi:GT2 family glycosyltransferase
VDEEVGATVGLSVVIPVRNGAPEIALQLDALAEQNFDGPWEVIVADNGSTDGTVAMAESFRDRLPGLRVVDASDRGGQAHAANVGARAARHRSLLFLDADDVVGPGYLAAMSSALDHDPFVAARLDCESLNPPWLWSSRPPMQTEGLGAPFGYLPSAAGCSLGVWRSTFAAVDGFDPDIRLGNDVDLCWRVQRAVGPMRFVPDAVVRYRYRETLGGIFAQARTYGTAGPTLYRRYRSQGMPRRPRRMALRFHGAAVVRLLRARSKADLAACAFLLGFRFGLVEGSVKNRIRYL